MWKRLTAGLAAVVVSAGLAFSANFSLLTTASGCNEASQLLACLNNLLTQLNGGSQPASGLISFGTVGTVSGATPLTLNTQRGVATFTGVTVAGVSTGALVLNDSLITAASVCTFTIQSDNSAAASFPYIRSAVLTAGVATISISNAAAATSTGASSFGIAFNCS